MRLLRIKAGNFRNLRYLDVRPSAGLNVLRGRNAQGKTNFIEAVFLALRGYSFRSQRDRELVAWDQKASFVEAELEDRNGRTTVRTELDSTGKRAVWAGEPVGKAQRAGRLGTVLFTPADLSLVKCGPRERRRFLDFELGVFVPGYFSTLQLYKRAVEQRNHLLRMGGGSKSFDALELWTDQVCEYGTVLLSGRLEILKEFAPAACRLFGAWAGEELSIRYRSSVELSNGARKPGNDDLRQTLAAIRREEVRAGQTKAGPHLDDLTFLVNGRESRVFASQGQQRSVVLALKLAQVFLWRRQTGEAPVVLLDDVLSEFDRERRDKVLETLQDDVQAFVTAGEAVLGAGRVFCVHSGNIQEES